MHQEYLDSIGFYQQYSHPHGFATMREEDYIAIVIHWGD